MIGIFLSLFMYSIQKNMKGDSTMIEHELVTWVIGLYERGQGHEMSPELRNAIERAAENHTSNNDDTPCQERAR